MAQEDDKKYMALCLELAVKALGNTYPNPLVGCVIVHQGKIIGQGYHSQAGMPHAEIEAIESVSNKELLAESTLYVNLEPCSHYGKTPPCSLRIIEHNIPKVVIGCIDTNSKVSGRGIKLLEQAGINVTVGVLAQESRWINRRFFTYHEHQRPYIILKWAQTKNKLIDAAQEYKTSQAGVKITDKKCSTLVHKWRTEEQAILVGTNTAIIDNPQLTARLAQGRQPLRLAIDLHHKIPQNANLKDGSVPTIIYSLQAPKGTTNGEEYALVEAGKNLWHSIFSDLHQRQVQSVIIEGGSKILHDLISHNFYDEIRVFTSADTYPQGIAAPSIPIPSCESIEIGNCTLQYYYAQ